MLKNQKALVLITTAFITLQVLYLNMTEFEKSQLVAPMTQHNDLFVYRCSGHLFDKTNDILVQNSATFNVPSGVQYGIKGPTATVRMYRVPNDAEFDPSSPTETFQLEDDLSKTKRLVLTGRDYSYIFLSDVPLSIGAYGRPDYPFIAIPVSEYSSEVKLSRMIPCESVLIPNGYFVPAQTVRPTELDSSFSQETRFMACLATKPSSECEPLNPMNCGNLLNGQTTTVVNGTFPPEAQFCPAGGNLTYTYEKLTTYTCTNGVKSSTDTRGRLLSQAGACNPPWVKILANGLKTITVKPGAYIKYDWSSSTGVVAVTSTYATTQSFCGQTSSGNWVVNTLSGTRQDQVQACQAALSYTIELVGKTATGITVKDSAVVQVEPLPATLSINKSTFVVGEKPFYTVKGTPGTQIKWTSTKDGSSTGESNSYYGHMTNTSGYWSGYGGGFLSSQIGYWKKTIDIGGAKATIYFNVLASSSSTTTVTSSAPNITGTNYRGVINGTSYLEIFGTFANSGNSVSMWCNNNRAINVTYQSSNQINVSWAPSTYSELCRVTITNSSGTSNSFDAGYLR